MSVLDRMKQTAAEAVKQAAVVGGEGARAAAEATGKAAAAGIEKAAIVARDPATHAKAKVVARGAAQGVKGALDKLNPSVLAGIVMKATAIQEQANAHLQKAGSVYRIGGIEIGAAFPPSVSFQIVRLADLDASVEAELDRRRKGIQPETLEPEVLEPEAFEPEAFEPDASNGGEPLA